jgi:hypothetical protein
MVDAEAWYDVCLSTGPLTHRPITARSAFPAQHTPRSAARRLVGRNQLIPTM